MLQEHELDLLMGQSNSIDQHNIATEKRPQNPHKTMNGHQNKINGENSSQPVDPKQDDPPAIAYLSQEYPESMMNLSLLDPPRWGWTAIGGVADVLTPHEVRKEKHILECCL